MSRRQIMPNQWLILDYLNDESPLNALRSLEQGSGVLVIGGIDQRQLRRLNRLARSRRLTVVMETRRQAARVHDSAELRRALLARVPFIFLSPVFATRSHPDWQPLHRMRAAALTRLANRRLLALGGMDARRYAIIAPLGFAGWAGISAFRT
jgi:thiamine-phosphate pyrophosphorylase